MEDEQVLIDYESMKKELENNLNSYDYNLSNLNDLDDITSSIPESVSTENLRLIKIPVKHYFRKLGLEEDIVSIEGLKETVATGWEKMKELALKIFEAIKHFFIKVKEYILKLFKKKADKQRADFHNLKITSDREINYNKEITVEIDEESNSEQQSFSRLMKNSETGHIDFEYLKNKIDLLDKIIHRLVNDGDDIGMDEIKTLDLNEFVGDKFPFGYELLKDIYRTDINKSFKYQFRKIEDNKLIKVSSITTSNIDKCSELLDLVDNLEKVFSHISNILSRMEGNINNYFTKIKAGSNVKKISNNKRKAYLENLKIVYGVLVNTGDMSIKMSKAVYSYNDISYFFWFKD